MKLYNSKTNTIEVFKPIEEGKVSMYVCGPTVYNHPHIGNARPIVVFDLLRRVLEADGFDVHYVSNYTDVDDRIIRIAQEEKVDESVISKRFEKAYESVRAALFSDFVDATPRVTENMEQIIAFIENLIGLGYAYESNGDVYFRVNKVPDYGVISSQNIEALKVGARIEANLQKESSLDFVLWKDTKDDGIKWDSPWGKGRPGWHTECVVMIQDEFKMNTIDIHGGGQDLKFPHHENESAQSKAVHHHDLANYWMHNAMLNLDGVKMSKSLGNVVWAKDYIKEFGANVTRWLLLSTHYRMTLNISEAVLEQVQNELNKIDSVLKQVSVKLGMADYKLEKDYDTEYFNLFMEALKDDLNVANASKVMNDLIKHLNSSLRRKDNLKQIAFETQTLIKMLDVLGLDYSVKILSDSDKHTFNLWEKAKQHKDFDQADVLRNDLVSKGLLS